MRVEWERGPCHHPDLVKKMAEDLTDYFKETGVKVKYMHSAKTLGADEIRDLRLGVFDALVGINLREGDWMWKWVGRPWCGIRKGSLRNERGLIQTIGRAARNSEGHVIICGHHNPVYAKPDETSRRRKIQMAYNEEHGIVPQTIKSEIRDPHLCYQGGGKGRVDKEVPAPNEAAHENANFKTRCA